MFLGNPPYATANEAGANGQHKKGVAKSIVGDLMKVKGLGKSSQQLFAQFIWRIVKIKSDFELPKVVIAFFINPIFFSSSEYWREFRETLFSNFGFKLGFIFPAGDFADVSANWGVAFIVLDSSDKGKGWKRQNEHTWIFDTLYLNRDKQKITKLGEKKLFYWPKQNSLSEWVREPIKNLKPIQQGWDCAQLSSGLKCSDSKGKPSGSLISGSIGYMVNVANNVYNSPTDTWIVSSSTYKGHGFNVTSDNFERAVVNFAVRLNVNDNWISHIDEYHLPNTTLEGYSDYVVDCAVFSLFHSKSNQTSVKDLVGPNHKLYTFINEWFPWSKADIASMADKNNYYEMYNDAVSDKERFMYKWLKKKALSNEAQNVLHAAWKVLVKTFPFRSNFDFYSDGKNGALDLHLMRWDAGWYQINLLLKSAKQEKIPEVEAFRTHYKTLGKKIQSKICYYGILKDEFGHFTRRPEDEAGSYPD